jgi:hypothetical protein
LFLLSGQDVFDQAAAGLVAEVPKRFGCGELHLAFGILERGFRRTDRLGSFHLSEHGSGGLTNERIVFVPESLFDQLPSPRCVSDRADGSERLAVLVDIFLGEALIEDLPSALLGLGGGGNRGCEDGCRENRERKLSGHTFSESEIKAENGS